MKRRSFIAALMSCSILPLFGVKKEEEKAIIIHPDIVDDIKFDNGYEWDIPASCKINKIVLNAPFVDDNAELSVGIDGEKEFVLDVILER